MKARLNETQKKLYIALAKHDWNKAFALCSSQEEIESIKNLLAVRYGMKLEQLSTHLVTPNCAWMIEAAFMGVMAERAKNKLKNEHLDKLKVLQEQMKQATSTDELLDLAFESLDLWIKVVKLSQ